MGCLLKHPIFLAFEKGARVDAPLLLVRVAPLVVAGLPTALRAYRAAILADILLSA